MGFISLLIISATIVINSLNYNLIVKYLTNELGISAEGISPIKVKKFPIPFLVIKHLKKEGHLELENVEIHFDPVSLIRLKPQISLIKISNATIYLAQNGGENSIDIVNHDQLISSFLSKKFIDINFNIFNVNILNKKHESLVVLTNCFFLKTTSLSEEITFKGVLDNRLQFSSSLEWKDNQAKFDLTLHNMDYNFHLLETYLDAKLVSGKGEYTVKNLTSLLSNSMPDLRALFRKINQHEMINIKFDILPSEQLLKLENLTLTGNSIVGNGLIHLSKKDEVSNIIKFTFPQIDMKALTASSENFTKFSDSSYSLRFIFGNKKLDAVISADQILLNNGEILNNIQLLLNLENSILMVKDFSGSIQSGGKFQFIGDITQNAVRSIFDGTVYLTHKNLNNLLEGQSYQQADNGKVTPFTLSSNLKFTLIDVYLQNLLIKTNNATIAGNITTRFIGSMPHIMANLEFSSLDLTKDDYPLISPIIKFAKSLTEGMREESYLTKYIPIRTIGYLGNFEVIINDMLIDNHSLGKIYMLANISPGNVEITNFDLRKNNMFLNLSGQLTASNIKPLLEIKIKDGTIDIAPLTPATLLLLRNKLVKEFDLDKIDLKIKCVLTKLTQGNLLLQNFKLTGSNSNTLFNISDLEADILSGKLKAAGNILLDPYTLNFVYGLNSINLAQLSKFLPQGFLDTYGGISLNGSLTTTGDSLEALLYNLTNESEFIVKQAKINNLSLDKLVEKINNKNYTLDYLKNDLASAISEGTTEIGNLRGNLSLKNGIATFKNILFNTKYISGTTFCAINIYNLGFTLTSILSFYINNEEMPQIGEAQKTLPVNVRLNAHGNIFNPIKTIDDIELKKFFDSKINRK